MNISNIKVGDTFKNYRELCEALEIEYISGGKSKQLQMETISLTVELEKSGYAFKVKSIKDSVQKKRNNRNTSNIILPVKMALLVQLRNSPELLISKIELAKSLKLINDKFSDFFYSRERIAKSFNMDIDTVNEFFDITKPGYESAIATALNQLKNEHAIIYETQTIISCYDDDTKTVDGGLIATFEEKKQIAKVKRSVMLKYGKSMQDVFLSGKFNLYKDELKQELFNKLKISSEYEAYKISALPEGIESELKYLLEKSGVDEGSIESLMKAEWSSRTNRLSKNRQRDAQKRIETRFGAIPIPLSTRVGDTYLTDIQKLHQHYTH